MAEEELIITFYKIHKCGYYKGKNRKFGDIEDSLEQLKKWSKKLTFFTDSAILPKIHEFGDSANFRNTYLYEITKGRSNHFLLTLWNELPDVEGKVATISKKKKIGDNIKCKIEELPKDSIPGTASYFWFLPEIGYYATVCKKGRTNNNAEMIEYIKTFLRTWTSHCITTKNDDGDIKIIGYKNNEHSEQIKNIEPCFQASRAEKKQEINFIIENCHKIRKMIRKETIKNNYNFRLDFMKRMLIHLGLKNPIDITESQKIRYEITYTPTENELQQLIDSWKKTGKSEDYDDTGFQFQGEDAGKIHWLTGSISRIKKIFSIEYYDEEIINAESLISALDDYQADLIKVLDL